MSEPDNLEARLKRAHDASRQHERWRRVAEAARAALAVRGATHLVRLEQEQETTNNAGSE